MSVSATGAGWPNQEPSQEDSPSQARSLSQSRSLSQDTADQTEVPATEGNRLGASCEYST
eukprot:12906202-Prorocentrum_lima.AAC.1